MAIEPAPDPFTFRYRLRVRWGECDMQGIVFNPHYMAYVDVGLTEYWRQVGLVYPDDLVDDGLDIFMVAAAQSWRDAARYDDELDVALRCEYLGNTSLRMAFQIRRGDKVLFSGHATYVVADRHERAPRPLGAMLTGLIKSYEAVPPAQKPV